MELDTGGTIIKFNEEPVSRIWPNPTNDMLHIDIPVNEKKNILARISDVQGKIIVEFNPKETGFAIDVQHYYAGIYNLQIISDKINERHLFVKY
jgi:hypothetical protein